MNFCAKLYGIQSMPFLKHLLHAVCPACVSHLILCFLHSAQARVRRGSWFGVPLSTSRRCRLFAVMVASIESQNVRRTSQGRHKIQGPDHSQLRTSFREVLISRCSLVQHIGLFADAFPAPSAFERLPQKQVEECFHLSITQNSSSISAGLQLASELVVGFSEGLKAWLRLVRRHRYLLRTTIKRVSPLGEYANYIHSSIS